MGWLFLLLILFYNLTLGQHRITLLSCNGCGLWGVGVGCGGEMNFQGERLYVNKIQSGWEHSHLNKCQRGVWGHTLILAKTVAKLIDIKQVFISTFNILNIT